jgi:hypothetical protein
MATTSGTEFPKVVSALASDKAANAMLTAIGIIQKTDPEKRIEGLKLIDNECIGLHIVSCAKLKKSNYSTRYEDKGQGVFVVRVNPRILEEEKWRKAAALEFLALIRRGFCAWEERDSSGVIIRIRKSVASIGFDMNEPGRSRALEPAAIRSIKQNVPFLPEQASSPAKHNAYAGLFYC